ncbi:MAG: dockerin type I repeat-containing protein [Bacteroidaceae bacterium]|nr:dockerin type I repeat-containing protein [Bacteroidaceae bacterium]
MNKLKNNAFIDNDGNHVTFAAWGGHYIGRHTYIELTVDKETTITFRYPFEETPGLFSNNKLYTLKCKRGGLVLNADATGLAAGQTRTDAPESDKRFAIITYNDAQYLYSPVNKQYLKYDGSFVSRLGSPLTFDDTHSDGEYKFMISTQNESDETWYFNNNGNIVINGWSTADDGNRWLIEPVADFDPTEALALAASQIFTVTYQVKYEGQVVATATAEVASGSALPPVPASLYNDFITLEKDGTHPTTVTENLTVQYNATWNGPFEFTKTESSAKWYNMHIRGGYYVGKQDTEPYYPTQNAGEALKTKEYQWAFGGDPYHVKVYNRTTGLSETLTKDGDNAVMRAGDYTWDLLTNNGGFVLRVTGTENTCINQFGGNSGPLKFWTNDNSPKDEGSTFRVEEVGIGGDVNGDGDITIADGVAVLNAMAGESVPGNPDVNGDGDVTIADFVAVLNLMAEQ